MTKMKSKTTSAYTNDCGVLCPDMMNMRIGVTSELYHITTKMKMSHIKRTRELGRNQRHIRVATESWYLARDGARSSGWTVLLDFEAAETFEEGTTFLLEVPEEDTARSSASKQDRDGMNVLYASLLASSSLGLSSSHRNRGECRA